MRRSYLIAGTIALLSAGWLASGMLFKSDNNRSVPPVSAEAAQLADPKPDTDVDTVAGAAPIDVPSEPSAAQPGELVSVQVTMSKAEPQPRTIVLRGRTEAVKREKCKEGSARSGRALSNQPRPDAAERYRLRAA